jgi:hypothetical protein
MNSLDGMEVNMTTELQFETEDKIYADLVSQYGIILMQLALRIRQLAESGDASAVYFFSDAFDEIVTAAREILKRKMV